MRREIDTVLSQFKAGKFKAYFNTIVSSEDVKCGKPSPEGYLLTATRLQMPPAKCLVIEDTPTGIRAAKAAGMYVIALQTSYGTPQLQEADQIEKDFTCEYMNNL